MSQADVFYQAMLARDYRFDGKFFIGVKTTRIYCRPICPAKPKKENVEFFTLATQAEKAGYRPCLRCRPESAPLSPAWYGKSAVVQRALKIIASSGLAGMNEDRFAAQFGITARHLRRLFIEEIGQTPKGVADNNRLNFARKLISETKMPITTVADTAGFSSLRRFNDAFKKRFHRAPLQLRQNAAKQPESQGIELNLAFRPPYDWETIRQFFKAHRMPGIDSTENGGYERIFKLESDIGWWRITPIKDASQFKLQVVAENPRILFEVVRRVRRMFDLDSDPLLVANGFDQIKLLSKLYDKSPGLRLPRGWDAFEIAICSILGQLVSIEHATSLVGQLIEHYGEEIIHPLTKKKTKIFPTANTLMQAQLAEVKTTEGRRASIRELSRRAWAKEISFSDAQDPHSFRASLLEIRGIGPWTAEVICLRAIGDTDAFPGTDLILRRALELHPDLDLEMIKPWRSYAAIYLWRHYAKTLLKRKAKKI